MTRVTPPPRPQKTPADGKPSRTETAARNVKWEIQRALDQVRGTNPLERYFEANDKRLIHKWMHYFDVYHRHFARFRGRPVTIVEIGVFHGGSLQMWADYFGPRATIWGVDIDPRCLAFQEPGINVVQGDQSDREFLKRLAAQVGPIDLLIDDGGHGMDQQIITMEELYGGVVKNGTYFVEDTHTSYWAESYGGGYKRPGTFMEYSKNLIDQLNAWHSESDSLRVDDFTRTTASMHFYDSIVVFEKGEITKPLNRKTGRPSFSD